MTQLHINLDPIAELRRLRKTGEPVPTTVALQAELAGADGIGGHLRQAARHLDVEDIKLWRQTLRIPVTLFLNNNEEMLRSALELQPARVVLLAERHEESAPSMGLDLLLHLAHVKRAVRLFSEAGIQTFLFMDPDLEQLRGASRAGVDGVLLNSLRYADALGGSHEEEEAERLQEALTVCRKYGLKTGAYRAISYRLAPKLREMGFGEAHVGQAIIARAIYHGLERAVGEMAALLRSSGS